MKLRLALSLILLVLAVPLFAEEEHPPASAGSGVPGSENTVHKTAQAGETHETEHKEKTYFGIPESILKAANLILFAAVLVYLLGGPIKKAFAERGGHIKSQLVEASERRKKADNFAADIDQRLRALEAEVSSILERAREDGERQKRELIAAGETEAQKILATARNEVDARLKLARKELTDYAGELASGRAREILQRELTDEDRKRLFLESVEELGEARS